jgi:hypothetical protein
VFDADLERHEIEAVRRQLRVRPAQELAVAVADLCQPLASGDRLASEPVVQRLAITDVHLGVAGGQRGGLRGAAGGGVGVDAAGD